MAVIPFVRETDEKATKEPAIDEMFISVDEIEEAYDRKLKEIEEHRGKSGATSPATSRPFPEVPPETQ